MIAAAFLALVPLQDAQAFHLDLLSPPGQRAFRFLESVAYFHDGTSGFGAAAPDAVRAMRWLWEEEHAADAFADLLAKDSRASELYGLVGLYYADPAAFEREVQRFHRSTALVPLASSCTFDERYPVGLIVEVTAGEVVRLDDRSQTTKQWAEKHGMERSGYRLDILGGGTPCLYRFEGGWREPARLPLPPAPEDDPSFTVERLSLDGRRAFATLRATTRFTDDAIGVGGETPPEVDALRRLWKEPRAANAFHALLRDAKVATGARLYALCGLYYAHPRCFAEEAYLFTKSEETIEYQSGCTIDGEHPVRDLVRSDRPVVVHLEQGQTIKAWAQEHAPEGGYYLDITGGGFPNLFRDGGGWYVPSLR